MFKFFRKYNKYILVVGVSMLMVAFLIQPTLNVFLGNPGDVPQGTIDGRTVTRAELQAADAELQILLRMPLLDQLVSELVGDTGGDGAMKWLLMVEDAHRLGLSASEAEVDVVLSALGTDEVTLARVVGNPRAGAGFIREAVRHLLMVEIYRELMLGLAHTATSGLEIQSPGYRRLVIAATAAEFEGQGRIQESFGTRLFGRGTPRFSEPLVKKVLHSQQSRVAGKVLLIGSEQYLQQIDPPSEEDLREFFSRYCDQLPRPSGGFGYRLPDRVKLEYLTIPIQKARSQVEVEEAEALDYYDRNRQEFVTGLSEAADQSAAGEGRIQPYESVRERIIRRLTNQKAEKLAGRMVKEARAILVEEVRKLRISGGYRDIPDDFQPLALSEVADRLTSSPEYSLRPIIRAYLDDWVTEDGLIDLPDMGISWLINDRTVRFADYVRSTRELKPAADNPLVARRLQVMLPSQPMRSFDGSYHLFRLVDAKPSSAPQDLAQVREKVERDARHQAAFERLRGVQEQWLSRARQNGLEKLGEQIGATVVDVPSMPRRLPIFLGGLTVNFVEGIGASEAFVDAMFDLAGRINAADEMQTVAEAERTGAVGVEPKLALALFRVDEFTPMSRSTYQRFASQPQTVAWALDAMQSTVEDPLSFEAVARRVGYVRDGEEADAGQEPRDAASQTGETSPTQAEVNPPSPSDS